MNLLLDSLGVGNTIKTNTILHLVDIQVVLLQRLVQLYFNSSIHDYNIHSVIETFDKVKPV